MTKGEKCRELTRELLKGELSPKEHEEKVRELREKQLSFGFRFTKKKKINLDK